jgi:hypothetical protein
MDAPAPPRSERFVQLAPGGLWLSMGSLDPASGKLGQIAQNFYCK